jgi:hypothetical protein
MRGEKYLFRVLPIASGVTGEETVSFVANRRAWTGSSMFGFVGAAEDSGAGFHHRPDSAGGQHGGRKWRGPIDKNPLIRLILDVFHAFPRLIPI